MTDTKAKRLGTLGYRKTAERCFLDWCLKHGLEPRELKDRYGRGERDPLGHKTYSLAGQFTLSIGPLTVRKMPQSQSRDWPTFIFGHDGHWVGGTPEIWGMGFPWDSDRYRVRDI